MKVAVSGTQKTTFGRTGFFVSQIGFGATRVSAENIENRAALTKMLSSGCNLIDTSTLFANGASEVLVRQVLSETKAPRNEIVLIAKAGYLQGTTLDAAFKKSRQGKPYADTVQIKDGCWHCLTPEFLEDQIATSLQRLGQDYVDAFLIQDPEFLLRALTGEDRYERFYAKIQAAFEHLEKEVQRGRIRHYGISSSALGLEEDVKDFVSIEKLWEIATLISEKHHFSVLQFPLNLFESDAVERMLPFAHTKNLAT